MNFRTEVHTGRAMLQLDAGDSVCWTGSCFAQHMADRLARYQFEVTAPGHGILFHPVAIARGLTDSLTEREYTEKDLIQDQGKWHSLAHHGGFSGADQRDVLNRIRSESARFRAALLRSDAVLITLGTSRAWKYISTGMIAGNCHKIPGNRFTADWIDAEESAGALCRALQLLHQYNPSIRAVVSVSPVRHWREGAVDNLISKSHLILAAQALCRSLPFVEYFPAYELMMDDLRDYRFYERDMIHPSEAAVDYIWEKFTGWCMDEEVRATLAQIGKWSRILAHSPLHDADSHAAAAEKAQARISYLLHEAQKKKPR
ncbi:MAG: GSCFA domain-containing protein [Flavobacteriales bacterium]